MDSANCSCSLLSPSLFFVIWLAVSSVHDKNPGFFHCLERAILAMWWEWLWMSGWRWTSSQRARQWHCKEEFSYPWSSRRHQMFYLWPKIPQDRSSYQSAEDVATCRRGIIHLKMHCFHTIISIPSWAVTFPRVEEILMLGSWLGHAVHVSALRVQSVFLWSVSSFCCLGGPCTNFGGERKLF